METKGWKWMKENKISCTLIESFDINPYFDINSYMVSKYPMDHWRIFFERPENIEPLVVYYSTGLGLRLNVEDPCSDYTGARRRHKLSAYLKWFKRNSIKIKSSNLMDFKHGIIKPPYPYDVFETIIDDALIYEEYRDWEEIGEEFGYDLNKAENRKAAKKIFSSCQEIYENLNKFLNNKHDLYDLAEIFRED